jgi:hypothetical protein
VSNLVASVFDIEDDLDGDIEQAILASVLCDCDVTEALHAHDPLPARFGGGVGVVLLKAKGPRDSWRNAWRAATAAEIDEWEAHESWLTTTRPL